MRPILVLVLSLASVAHAENTGAGAPAPASPPGWEFTLAPYLWGSGMEGTLRARGVSSDVDVDFSDIWDALDVGVLAAFEARNGRLSLTTNLVYLKLSTDAERPVGAALPAIPPGSLEVDADVQTLIFEQRAAWELFSVAIHPEEDERRISLDVGPGLRVWWLDNELDVRVRPGLPLPAFSQSFEDSTDWIDLLVGARVRARPTERLALILSGDYGGFGLGSSSDDTWSVAAFAAYDVSDHWSVAVGWRTIQIDRDAVDLRLEGPLIGASYRF
jgi:hypothetical protein